VCLNNAVPKAAKRRLPGDEDSAYFDDDDADAALGTVSICVSNSCIRGNVVVRRNQISKTASFCQDDAVCTYQSDL